MAEQKTIKRKPKKFMRRDWTRLAKLGKKVKKNQTWKRPTGRDNKMREKRRGYPAVVSIGYRTDKIERGKIYDKKLVTVNNARELEKVGKNEIAVLGSVGKKKKLEIANRAKEKGIEIQNLNIGKFIKKNTKPVKSDKTNAGEKPKENKK